MTASTPASGNRCVDINEKYNCPSDFWTDKCEVGYTCNMTTLQCTQSAVRPDYKTMADCQTSCVTQPPPPPTPSPAPVSRPRSARPAAVPAALPVPGRPQRAAVLECQPGGNATGVPAQFGAILRAIRSSTTRPPSGATASRTTKDSDQKCTHPDPPPPELIGLWRGLELHKGYQTGEWVGEITNNSVKIYAPQKDGSYKSGSSAAPSRSRRRCAVRALGHLRRRRDPQRHRDARRTGLPERPSVGKYVQICVDEASSSTPADCFDTAMKGATTKVLGLETCPGGSPTPPPSDKYKCVVKPDTGKYRCDTASRQCIKDDKGTLSPGECQQECNPATPSPPPPGQCVGPVGYDVEGRLRQVARRRRRRRRSATPRSTSPPPRRLGVDHPERLEGRREGRQDLAAGFDMSPATGKGRRSVLVGCARSAR